MKNVGKPLPHESAAGHVTGQALYTDDLVARFPDALTAWPVQAGIARGTVEKIDAQAALAVPGVVAVLTAADVPGENDTGPARHDEPLFPEEVSYHGQAVAWVLGENDEAARLGAAAVAIEVSPLPAVLTIEEAIDADSFHTPPLVIRRGDPEGALAKAPLHLHGEIHVGGQEHFYLETQAALAYRAEDGSFFVHSSTQHPSETQEICARVLGVPRGAVVVQSLRMGGAFGGKEVQANPYGAVAALGVHKTGRPVRVRLTRQQDMVLTGKRHPFLGRFQVGFGEDGKLHAVKIALYSDGGWSLDLSEPVMFRAMFHVDNAYLLPHAEVVGRVAKTHKTSQTAFRGFGGPQGMAVIEEIMDRVARTVGLPPEVVRRRNLYQEGDTAHYGEPIKDAARLTRIVDDLEEKSDFAARRRAIAAFNAKSPHRKRGIALTPVKFGISFTTAFFNQAGALVLVYQDGSVHVNHGGTEMGQGLHTKMLQVAADALGVPLLALRLMPTRTDKVPNTSATAAASGADLNGAAVKAACETLRGRLADVAGRLLGAPARELAFEDGKIFHPRAPDSVLAFSDVARAAYLERVPLFAVGYYSTPGIHYDKDAGQGNPFHYYAYGAAVTEVEVCGFTGMYAFRRVDILHDVGDSLSPLVDRGQIEGGYIQGVGWLTLEELVWDGEGRLLTRGASTYKLPGLGETPGEFHVHLLPRAAEPGVVYGSKAVGEPPLMLALSAREALRDAVAAFGDGGPVELGCPATPEAVYWAIEKRRARATERPTSAATG